jgi:hypothetical protein
MQNWNIYLKTQLGMDIFRQGYPNPEFNDQWKFYGRTIGGMSSPFLKFWRNFSKIPVRVPTGTTTGIF